MELCILKNKKQNLEYSHRFVATPPPPVPSRTPPREGVAPPAPTVGGVSKENGEYILTSLRRAVSRADLRWDEPPPGVPVDPVALAP